MTRTFSFFFWVTLTCITHSLLAQNTWSYTDVNNRVTIQLPAEWDSLAYAVKSDIFNNCEESRLTVSSGDVSGAEIADVTVSIEEISNISSKIVSREGLTDADADYLTLEEEYNKLADMDSKLESLEELSVILYQYDSLYQVIKKEPLTLPNTLGSWVELTHYRDLGEGKGVMLHRLIIHQLRGNRLLITEIECREDKWKIYGDMLENAARMMSWKAK